MNPKIVPSLIEYLNKMRWTDNISTYNNWINESGISIDNPNDAYWILGFINRYKNGNKNLIAESLNIKF